MKRFCFFLLLFIPLAIHAQPDTTQIKAGLDSAWKMMQRKDKQLIAFANQLYEQSKKIGYTTGQGQALYTIGRYYINVERFQSSVAYYDSARALYEHAGDKRGLALVYEWTGTAYFLTNDFPIAIDYFDKAAALNIELGRKDNLANVYTNMGLCYEKLGDYSQALDYYLKCLKIDEELDYKPGIASDYACIALIYGKMNEIGKASTYYEKAIAQGKELGDDFLQGSTLTNYGILLKNNRQYDKSMTIQQEALALFKKVGSDRGAASTLHNIGSIYQAKKDYPKALSYYDQSIKAMAEPNKEVFSSNYYAMGEVYFAMNQYTRALEYAGKALEIAKDIKKLGDQEKSAKLLSNIYSAQGNYKQALEYYKLSITHKDSLFNEVKSRQFKDLEARYETEKKQQEINALTQEGKLQEASLEAKTAMQYELIGGFLLLAILAFVAYRNIRARQEAKRLLLAEQLKNEHMETERFRELDHLKSRFFANIAHEFRTPLTLILGPVENLLNDSSETSQKNQLTLVKNNASRLVKLVNQLLDLSKLEAGAIKFDYVQEDVIQFLKANTFAFQSIADQKKITISFECQPVAMTMQFDRDKLEKIFSNLLSNAFKFTPQNGRVRVAVEGNEQTIRVVVTDSGPGIPADDLPYVFNRFYQSGTVARSTTGSGIGLELTKELVEICGGKIGVTNTTEGGAQFWFTLPVTVGESLPGTPPSVLQHTQLTIEDVRITLPLAQPETEEGRELVLVIEDNEDVRDFIISSLQAHYQIVSAVNGEEGVTKALEIVPDLIITDVMMPVRDGIEVCRILKGEEKTSHIPIIMLTAKADVESKIEGLQSGADDYLAKPFNTKELLVRIQNLVHIRKKLQEKFQSVGSNETAPVEDLPLREKLFLDRLRENVELHLAEEEYSVEELSRDMAMSRMQLHRKLKALMDTSASLYIRNVRLTHGRRLLEEGLYNVSEVAYRVGFNSPTYFSTCFSELYGFPPSEVKLQRV